MRGQRNQQRGFTLLELLMVVIIIAILASIALPQYFRVTERSRTAQALQILASIRGSQLRFKAQNPLNLYDIGAMGNIDLAATVAPFFPVMTGWGAPTSTGPGAGSNVTTARSAGVHLGATLQIDLDSGNVCASTAAAAGDWGVSAVAC